MNVQSLIFALTLFSLGACSGGAATPVGKDKTTTVSNVDKTNAADTSTKKSDDGPLRDTADTGTAPIPSGG